MRDAAKTILDAAHIDYYEFGLTANGHQFVILHSRKCGKTAARKIFFAGGHGKDQAAMHRMRSFLKKEVAALN